MRLSRLALAALSTFAIAAGAAACSDPVPPTPQGAWTVSFISPGAMCHVAGHNAAVGSVTSDQKTTVLVDAGPEGAQVSCSVVGTSTFAVTGDVQLNGSGLQISIPKISKAATQMSPAPGQVAFASDKTSGLAYQSPTGTPCNFYFTQGSPESVASGRIWVAFTCDKVAQGMPASVCSIKQGYVILENCAEM
jgi:hypothetical protein